MQASIGYSYPRLIEGALSSLDGDIPNKQCESLVIILKGRILDTLDVCFDFHLLQRGSVTVGL